MKKVAPSKKATPKKAVARKAVPKKAPAKKTKAKKTAKTVKAPARRAAALAVGSGKRRKPEGKARRVRPVAPVEREVRVRALDPVARCGPNTSVEQLYRVDEDVNGRRTVHLVFFDRHGWYCEHGRDCVAVKDARKLGVR
jgi:hypothetical protein